MKSTEPSKLYTAIDCCIYCGSKTGLTKEHIIALGIGGNWILPQASCMLCATITGKFEQFCLRPMLGSLRIRMKLPTRRPKERPTHPAIEFIGLNGKPEKKRLPADSVPFVCMGYRFPAPGLLRSVPPTDRFEGKIVVRTINDELKSHIEPEGVRMKLGTINILAFAQMLAKIGHAYAVAELGLNGFLPMLPDIILGKSTNAPYLVGGDESGTSLPESEPVLHSVYLQNCVINGTTYVLAAIRLFAFCGMSRYHIVVGKVHAGTSHHNAV